MTSGGISAVTHLADDVRPALQRQHLACDEGGDEIRPLEPLRPCHLLDLVAQILHPLRWILGHVALVLLGEWLLIEERGQVDGVGSSADVAHVEEGVLPLLVRDLDGHIGKYPHSAGPRRCQPVVGHGPGLWPLQLEEEEETP